MQIGIKTLSPDINFQITEKLKRKLDQQPGLKVVEDSADFKIDGAIENLTVSPFSIGANKVVYLNRVTLNISITRIDSYENKKTVKNNIEAFANYDAKLNFNNIKDSIYDILSDRIVDNIYSEMFLRW